MMLIRWFYSQKLETREKKRVGKWEMKLNRICLLLSRFIG